ncbi:MAG: primosomal protein [Actinobacteria bacterium]|nr:primosomal protein [Actinomycetota bacterium]
MSADPRAALATFVSALERHLEAASSRRGENDPAVVAAYQDLAEAFDAYDDALMEAFGEVTPLEIYSGDDEDDDIDDDFDDDIDEDDDDDDEDDDDDDEDDDIDFDDDDDEADGAATPTL